jgi:hypothetical protein
MRRLRKVEQVARSVDFNPADNFIQKCQLPELVIGSNAPPKMLWPPPQPNYALEYALSVGRMMSGPAMMPPTEQQRAEASRRHMQYIEEREQGREKLNAEAAARAAAHEAEQKRFASGG